MIDLLFNFLLLMFWVRLFPPEQDVTYFNPYIAWINRISRIVLNRIRIKLPQVSPKQAAGMVFALLLILRAIVMPGMRFGLEVSVPVSGLVHPVLLSAASFAMMLFYLWTAYLVLAPKRSRGDAMSQCMRYVARPLPQWSPQRRWMAVVALGLVISSVLVLVAHAAYSEAGLAPPPPQRFLLRIGVNTAAALVDLLAIMQTLLIAAVIGSWMSLLAPSDALAAFCQDAMALLIGPLRDYRLAVGPLDLTPLLAVVALMLLHSMLMSLLIPLYESIVMMGV